MEDQVGGANEPLPETHRNGGLRQRQFASIAFYGLAAFRSLASALVVCYAISVLLDSALRFRDLRQQKASAANAQEPPGRCELDTLPSVVAEPEIPVTGRASRFEPVKIAVNGKELGPYEPDGQHRFSATVPLSRQVNRISVSCQGIWSVNSPQQVHYITAPLLAPEIRNAVNLGDGRSLLVGQTDANSGISIIGGGKAGFTASANVSEFGVFILVVDSGLVDLPGGRELEVSNARVSDRRTVSLAAALEKSDRRPVVRTSRLDLSTDDATLRFDITASAKFPYFAKLMAGDMSSFNFVAEVFGWSGAPLSDQRIHWQAEIPESGLMSLRLNARLDARTWREATLGLLPGGGLGLSQQPLWTAQDTFTVSWKDGGPRWFLPSPTALEPQKAVWKGPLARLEFSLLAAPEQSAPPPPQATLRESLKDLRLPFGAGVLGSAVLSFLPFGWVLYAFRRHLGPSAAGPASGADGRLRVGAAALVLGVLVLRWPAERLFDSVTALLADGLSPRREGFWILWLCALAVAPVVARLLEKKLGDRLGFVGPAGNLVTALKPVILRALLAAGLLVAAGWLWQRGPAEWLTGQAPWLKAALESLKETPEATHMFRMLGAFWVFSALAGFGVSVPYLIVWAMGLVNRLAASGKWPDEQAHLVQVLVVGAAVMVAVTIAPIRRLWGASILGGKPWRRFAAALLVLVVLVGWGQTKLAIWASGVAATWTYLWIALFLADILRDQRGRADPKLPFATSGLYIASALFCYPSHRIPSEFWRVNYLLNHFNEVAKYLLLAGVLAWIWRENRNSAGSDLDRKPWLACGLFAFFLVGSAGHLLYIPIPLIVGYLAASRWLFRSDKAVLDCALSGSEKGTAVEQLIDFRRLEGLREHFRQAHDRKLQKGEITLLQHQTALDGFERDARGTEQTGQAHASLRALALAGGPNDSAWQNAMTAVKYGVPLALAPAFLSVFQFTSDTWSSPFVIPAFFLELCLQLSYWLLIAWFLGYFYRSMRGSTGLSKGVLLAIFIVAPFLLLRLLLLQRMGEMSPFFIWAGQNFAYCALLGLLAFDYETLRQCGFPLRQLVVVHRLPALSALGSSLLAAMGPLILALSQGKWPGFANFAVNLVKTLIPEAKGQ